MIAEDRVVSIVTFHVTAATFASAREEVTEALQRRVSALPGLIAASVLINEQTTRLMIVSTWQSRHSWAVAQWDEHVQQTIADVFHDTASYDIELFSLLASVEPKRLSTETQ